MSDTPKNNGTYELITPVAIATSLGGEAGFDEDLATKADTAMQVMRDEFLQHVAAAVDEIDDKASLAETPEQENANPMAEIAEISNDLQMQGVAFGFSLASDICASLSGYMKSLSAPTDMAGKIVRAHTDALRSVAANVIEGDGGSAGQELIESLNSLVAQSKP